MEADDRRMKVQDKEYVGYSQETVEQIVRRMKKLYMARGLTEEEASEKALKSVVGGSRTMELETRGPKDLVTSKNKFFRLVGGLFTKFDKLNRYVDKLADNDFAVKLMRDLDSASIYLSTKQYLAISLVASLFGALFFAFLGFLFFVTSSIITALLVSLLAFIVGYGFSFFVAMIWPSSTAKNRGKEMDKVLPFALRHMATEIRAGVGIHDAMRDIVDAKYGVLSEEFRRALDDMDKGMTTDDAIQAMGERSPSDTLARVSLHIVRSLRTGGSLSDILSEIAKDVSFDLQVRMRDFVEKLSLISLMYMMAGIVMPVFFTVLAAIFNSVPTLGFQGVLGPTVLMLVYIILIPAVLAMILYIIKVMQPM